MKSKSIVWTNAARILTTAIILVTVLLSCSGTQPTQADIDGVVVAAYLYVGQPVNDIRLTHLQKAPTDSFDTSGNMIMKDSAIQNAKVTLTDIGSGTKYTLILLDTGSEDSGYYGDSTIIISQGKTYRLDVSVPGLKSVSSETTVPQFAGQMVLSQDTLHVQSRGAGGFGGRSGTTADTTSLPAGETSLNVTWTNSDTSNYFYYVLQTIIAPETTTTTTNTYGGNYTNNFRGSRRRGNFTKGDSLSFSTATTSYSNLTGALNQSKISLTSAGHYRLWLYATTPEYDAILKQVAQDSSTSQDQYREAITNITNGFGVLAAFTCDSADFYVVSP